MSLKIDWPYLWKEFDDWLRDISPLRRNSCRDSRVCEKIEELVCEQLGIHRFTDAEAQFCEALDALRLTAPEAQELLTDKGRALHFNWRQQQVHK